MAKDSLKDKTVKGVAWSGIERFSVQGIQFLVMLVIARILDPKDFGLLGMLAIFLAVAQSLIDSGFSQALIRKQNRTETDNSTVFYFNIIVSLFIYFVFFISAPMVSVFYGEPKLTSLMRVLCLIVIINSFAVVQRAIFTANIDFKTQAKASFVAAFVSGGVGVYLAVKGYGVWTLVWQQILNAFINTILLWFFSVWRPKLLFSWISFKELFSFGSKLMLSGLIDTVYTNMYSLVIGKVYTAESLGHYTQAKNFVRLPSQNINGILGRVIYPILCTVQNDNKRLQNDYRKLLRVSAFIVFPLMCCLAGIAYPLVDVLIGEKWHYAATLIIPLCFNWMWYPVAGINLSLLQVKGRSDLFLRLEIIKKLLGVVVLIISLPFGLLFMCYSTIFNAYVCLIINMYYTGKLINIGFYTQMKDLAGTLCASLSLFVIVFVSTNFIENVIVSLLFGITIGVVFFVFVVIIFKFEELDYLKNLVIKQ